MALETLTAYPEVRNHTGSETTSEHRPPAHQVSEPVRDIEGASPDGGEIALVAYRYWQERGCPDGGAEEDWYRAERELIDNRANGSRG